jgi:Polyketide cyclase / dehydrase and lipid transport
VTAISGEHRADAERTCSVLVGKKTGEVRERCVEAEPERAITWLIEHDTTGFTRMASNPRTGFTLAPHGGGTLVTARSAFEPRNIAVRAMMPLIRRKFHATQEAILACLAESVSHPSAAGL